MAQVFICHVKEDADLATSISKSLEEAGYSTWHYKWDGTTSPSNLPEANSEIDRSEAVALLISEAAMTSDQVSKEVVRAHESKKPIIPVLIGVSHAHIQSAQAKWKQAIGNSASLEVERDHASVAVPRLLEDLRALNILPQNRLNSTLLLAIIDAAVEYTLYTVNLLNLAATTKKGDGLAEAESAIKSRASSLQKTLAACNVEVPIPEKFASAKEIEDMLRRSPLVGTIAISLRQRYSEQEGLFFMFCVLIGGILSARETGVAASGSAAVTEAQKLGRFIRLPEEILKSCISEPGFHALREYLKSNS